MKVQVLAFLTLSFLSTTLVGQEFSKKGKVNIFWGYSREIYTKSDIHLVGEGYDYTLYNVKANDLPEEPSYTYINPEQLTVPQFDFRVAYYFNDHYAISAGWDHMKYKLQNGQTARITGTITQDALNDGTWENNPQSANYVGEYVNDEIVLSKDFIKYEHTDGLNFARVSIERIDRLYHSKWFTLTVSNEFGTGPVLPWTDFTHLGGNRHTNRLHVSGWGFGLYSGLRAEYKETFYFTSNVGGGFINLHDVETKQGEDDWAKQRFWFAKWNFGIGVYLTAFKQDKE